MEARATTLREATEGTVQRMFCDHLGRVLDEIQRFYDERERMIMSRHAAQMEAARAEIRAVKAEMEAMQYKHQQGELMQKVNELVNEALNGNIDYRLDWFEDEVENLRTDPDYHGTRSKAGIKSVIYKKYSELSGDPVEQNKAGRSYERGGKARALLMDDSKARNLILTLLILGME